MSKKKNKNDNKDEIPIDHQVESKNLQYTITLKDVEIENLKAENLKRKQNIIALQTETSNLKDVCSNKHLIEKKLQKSLVKNENQQKEINKLNNELSNIQNKFNEEKKELEKFYNAKINQLNQVIANYDQKIEYADRIIKDNRVLKTKINDLNIEKDNIIKNNISDMKKKEIQNDLRFSRLKLKMINSINQSQEKVLDINKQYLDLSTKMILYENKKLILEKGILAEEIEKLKDRNKNLENKLKELNNEIEIHKKVELSMSEKNKKMKLKLKGKGIDPSIQDEISCDSDSNGAGANNLKKMQNGKMNHSNSDKSLLEEKYAKIISLEKQILELEKKLKQKNDEYSTFRDKYILIKNLMKGYEEKYILKDLLKYKYPFSKNTFDLRFPYCALQYSNFYKYLDDCLDNFFVTQQNNQNFDEQKINLIKNYDFSTLSKEEKYSSIVILMNNLLPLISETKSINEHFYVNDDNKQQNLFNQRYLFSNEKKRLKKNNLFKFSFKSRDNSLPNIKNLLRSGSKKDKNTIKILPTIISYENKKFQKMPSSVSMVNYTDN